MKLWLLRHGEAQPRAARDELRELTVAGRAAVGLSAERLIGVGLDAILASPYARAQQTAEIVRQRLAWSQLPITATWATPDGEVEPALRALEALQLERILLVTHNPFVGELAGWLMHGHRQMPVGMGTACLLCLEAPLPLVGSFELIERFDP